MIAKTIPLGNIICQRHFDLYDDDGKPHTVTVKLGRPTPTDLEGGLLDENAEPTGTFRCPFQIAGLGHDEHTDAIFGEDPFVALQYAIDFIGIRLDAWSAEQKLSHKHRAPGRTSWVWTYLPDQQSILRTCQQPRSPSTNPKPQ